MTSMNSRTRTLTGDLARMPAEKSRNFLVQAANLTDDQAAIDRFASQFGYLVPNVLKTYGSPPPEKRVLNMLNPEDFLWQVDLREALRHIWLAPDLRTREWGVFRMLDRAIFAQSNPPSIYAFGPFNPDGKTIRPLPPMTQFEQMVNYLRSRLHCLKVCPNKDGPAPYFFATRSSQVYCSYVCALPRQREFKRQWWAKHGATWRRKRTGRRPS